MRKRWVAVLGAANEESILIISHRHRFIFIKTMKTAGTSIEIALSRICGPDDIITAISPEDEAIRHDLGYRGAQHDLKRLSRYTIVDWAKLLRKRRRLRLFYNHISAREIRDLIPAEVWRTYYKFSFDRNPWDKSVSRYFWYTRKPGRQMSFDEFIESGWGDEIGGFDIYTIGGALAVDDLFRYEELPDALDTISMRLNLQTPLSLPSTRAKGDVRPKATHYREVLSEEARKRIAVMAAREIELLGYSY